MSSAWVEDARRTANLGATSGRRLIAVLFAIACLAVLVVGACVTPAHAGHGTHTQLGMPPCGLAMMLGSPCPTCGMTTAVAYAARFEFVNAWNAQPAGLAFALLAGVGLWACVHTATTGSSAAIALGGALIRPRGIWIAAILGTVGWVWKLATWKGF